MTRHFNLLNNVSIEIIRVFVRKNTIILIIIHEVNIVLNLNIEEFPKNYIYYYI